MLVLLILIFFILLFLFPSPNKRAIHMLKDVKGFPTLPIIGNVHQLGFNPVDIYKNIFKLWKQSGYGTFKLFIGNDIIVYLTEPETAKEILSNTQEISKSKEYEFMRPLFGNGILLSTGDEWRKNRKLLTPAFHFKILERFLTIFNKTTIDIIEYFSKNTDKPIDVFDLFSLLTLDIILESALGKKINTLKNKNSNENSEYYKSIYKFFEICNLKFCSALAIVCKFPILYKMTQTHREEMKCVKVALSFGNRIIQKRKLDLKDKIENNNSNPEIFESDENTKEKLSFLDILLLTKNEDGTQLDEKMIADEVNILIAAGHETSASLLSFFLFMLSKHSEIQKKVFEEQYSIFGEDKMKDVTSSDCSKMKYMEMVIKETFRILPSVPYVGRKLENDLPLKDGVVLPAGITVLILLHALGINPKYVKNPEVFDPERFSYENIKGNHPYIFLPFSAGPRNCIGQKFALLEIKVILSKLIRNFEFYNEGIEDHNLQLSGEITMKSKNGVIIKLRQRK